MPHIIIGQILGIVAPFVTFISYQVNSKNKLLILKTVATVTICISYLLLGGNSGFALNIVCTVRNLTFFFLDPKSKANRIAAVILALAMGGMGMLSWEGPISALMVVALMANTIFMSFGDPQLLRKSVIGTSSLILGNYGEQYSQSVVKDRLERDIQNTLQTLSKNENGFFIMYEEAYIDKHSHSAELPATFFACVRFNQAIGCFMEYAFYHPETVVIITADHETYPALNVEGH